MATVSQSMTCRRSASFGKVVTGVTEPQEVFVQDVTHGCIGCLVGG